MYLVNGWLLGILIFCTCFFVILWLFAIVHEAVFPIIKRKRAIAEYEAELGEQCLPADVEAMEAQFPGPIDGEMLIQINAEICSALDAYGKIAADNMDELYDQLDARLSTEAREYIHQRIELLRYLQAFHTFCQSHAVDPFLTYLQNGDVFFEEGAEEDAKDE